MIKNYFTIAIRNLLKHKLFTTLNIFGLSLSMSICLVLILLVYDHYQYDKFHKNPENTYRIISFYTGEDGTFDDVYATSPAPFKNSLKDQYSFIEEISNLNSRFNGEIRSEHKILNINSLYADNSFFQIFGFEMAEGDARTALSEPMNIVLTADLAEKLFPKESALGKTVEFEDHGSYVVSGVLKPNSENTHIKFEALASFSSLDLLADKKIVNASHNDWKHVWSNYNYLILRNESDREKANKVINEIAAENIKLEADHPGYTFRLQSLSEIVPGRPMANEIGFTLPWFVLSFFGLLGLVVLITASINYTNLSMAKSLSRAKEIGIRKVNGASKKQIVAQFLLESVLTAT
ncbi:MAG: ABC transporter permease, partial [Ekhidna sp.]|nr:ABC transporter permease [Ekhidna sp.]